VEYVNPVDQEYEEIVEEYDEVLIQESSRSHP
jgi:hypothetical protein